MPLLGGRRVGPCETGVLAYGIAERDRSQRCVLILRTGDPEESANALAPSGWIFFSRDMHTMRRDQRTHSVSVLQAIPSISHSVGEGDVIAWTNQLTMTSITYEIVGSPVRRGFEFCVICQIAFLNLIAAGAKLTNLGLSCVSYAINS